MELKTILYQRVVDRDEVVETVSRAIHRAYGGLKDPARPTSSFIFLGPTGARKMEPVKTLAETMFGSEEALIRVDMSKLVGRCSTGRLVGSPPGCVGYEESGQLAEKAHRHSYSVILLDEVEKAHPDVFNILLQVLDDGRLADARGWKANSRDTILIVTSNLKATAIREEKHAGFNVKDISKNHELIQKRTMEELKKTFRPESLNRIDKTVVFHSLK